MNVTFPRCWQPGILACLSLLFVTCFQPVARGQSTSGLNRIPAQQNPGLLTPSPMLQEVLKDKKPQKLKQDDEIKLDLPESEKKTVLDSPPFLVREVRLVGVTYFSPEEIKPVIEPYVGKDQTLGKLNSLTQKLMDMYRARGYLTTEAFFPPQEIRDGILTVQVQEGYIGNIAIEGSNFYKAKLVKRALHQKPGALLNFRTLEKDLNQINRLADGYKVKAILSAGEMPGETQLKLLMAEQQPLQVSTTYDNMGRPFIGYYRGGVEFQNKSLTGWGDTLNLRVLSSGKTNIAQASYSVPLNRFGTELSGNFAFSRVNVVLDSKDPPKILSKSYTTGLNLSQPLNPSRTLTLSAGITSQRLSSFFEGDQTSATDVRTVNAGLTYSKPDHWGSTYMRLQNTVGIGGAKEPYRFWKVENYLQRVHVLPRNNLLILKAYGQMTPDALPSVQKFQIGGDNNVRGYSNGLLVGDNGFNIGLEHRFPVPGLTRVNPWLGNRLQLSWFFDYGRVWTDHSSPSYSSRTSDLRQTTLLKSFGVGIHAQLTRFMQGYVDFGFGLVNRDRVEPLRTQPTARVHFGIRTNLLADDYRVRNQKQTIYKMKKAARQLTQQ